MEHFPDLAIIATFLYFAHGPDVSVTRFVAYIKGLGDQLKDSTTASTQPIASFVKKYKTWTTFRPPG